MLELKPCPFCGYPEKPHLEEFGVGAAGYPGYHKEYTLACQNCGATGPNDLGWSGATVMWNLRRDHWPPNKGEDE